MVYCVAINIARPLVAPLLGEMQASLALEGEGWVRAYSGANIRESMSRSEDK